MDSKTIRQKYLKFFEKNGHVVIPSASLVPSEEEQLSGKEKVLFTSAGMQPLIPYLLGKPHPKGKRLVDVQKCLRTDDIEEVGDSVHHTFFEMLGNWSLGEYWKEKAIKLSFEFLTKELNIPINKLAVSVFAGDDDAPKDEESAKIWKSLGIPEERIFYFGKDHNWWPSGEQNGPCGPDTEMFYWAGERDPEGEPNKDPRWVEIWNDVFMQFNRKSDGKLEDLPQKNVDTGMGLERTLAVLTGKKSDYETDLFWPIIEKICKGLRISYGQYKQPVQVIADHIKASVFLIKDGVTPNNKMQGYVLRRLLRRAATKAFSIDKQKSDSKFFKSLTKTVMDIYPMYFEEVSLENVEQEISLEIRKFRNTLEKGLKVIEKMQNVDGKAAFDLYQSYGFPSELTEELLREKGLGFNKKQFDEEFEKHRELSRTASAGMFKGGLADHGEVTIKYHTATHLLHQALRDVLGPQVFQKGSNITSERLRFDFSFDRKMTAEEIKQVEDLVNQRINDDLKVDHMIVPLDEAKKMNAIGLFDEKYADKVSLYGIGLDGGRYYSLEFCGGPHVEHTGSIGKIKITKEEAISSGIRRIKAEIVLR